MIPIPGPIFWDVKSGTFRWGIWLQKKKHVDLKKVTFGPCLFGGCFMFGLFSFLGSILSRTKKDVHGHFLVPKKRSLSGLPPLFFGGFAA